MCIRDRFLAGTAFAKNQNARVRRRDGLDELADFADFWRFADDLIEGENMFRVRAKRGVFTQKLVAFGAARDGVEQFFGRKRLGQIINRAGFDGFHGEFGRRVSREHEGGKFRPLRVNFSEKFVTAHAAEPRVGDDHEKFLAR